MQNKGADVVVKGATVKNQLNTEKEPETAESEIKPLPQCATISVNFSSWQFIAPERECCAMQHKLLRIALGFVIKIWMLRKYLQKLPISVGIREMKNDFHFCRLKIVRMLWTGSNQSQGYDGHMFALPDYRL